ncbi:MAG: cation:proton antiporter [Gammaproteobacteria bacterium]
MSHDGPVADLVLGVSLLLLLAAATLALARRLHAPFSLLLVLIGLGLGRLTPSLPPGLGRVLDLHIGPGLILFVFLPSLIFESASKLDWRELRDDLTPVLTLAVPGVLLSTCVIGALLALLAGVPMGAALVLGAILSATDPVAVIALFRQLGAPRRLTVLVEGESLLNDAAAIVLTKLLLGIALAGHAGLAIVPGAVGEFAVTFLGGIAVGGMMALAAGSVVGLAGANRAITLSVLTTLAYLSFLVAEEFLHVSGVMATLCAGLVMGSWGRSKIAPAIADVVEHFWSYVAFMANALIFLLMGLSIDFPALAANVDLLVLTILAMLLARALVIYGLLPLIARLRPTLGISFAFQTVMFWGGLRGAVSLALVLSLQDFAWFDAFVAVVTGVVLFTLVVQGLSVEPLMRRLRLDRPGVADRLARDEALSEAALVAAERIPGLSGGGHFSAALAARLAAAQRARVARLRAGMSAMREQEVDDGEAARMLWMRATATERNAYRELFALHHVDERTYRALDHDAAVRLDELRHFARAPRAIADEVDVAARRALGWLARLPGRFGRLAHTRAVARDYARAWAVLQACDRVDGALAHVAQSGAFESPRVDAVRDAYRARGEAARARLDDWAEQFPEFVRAMQTRLAERLILQVEQNEIERQLRSGLVPPNLGDELRDRLAEDMRRLGPLSIRELEVAPEELLRKVPFFADLGADEVAEIVPRLEPLTVAAGEDIVRAGERGTSMYFIGRGVVHVFGAEADGTDAPALATLLAGDFFGEMALLDEAPRNATCRAATACALYELDRRGVTAAVAVCPTLGERLAEAAAERRGRAVTDGSAD